MPESRWWENRRPAWVGLLALYLVVAIPLAVASWRITREVGAHLGADLYSLAVQTERLRPQQVELRQVVAAYLQSPDTSRRQAVGAVIERIEVRLRDIRHHIDTTPFEAESKARLLANLKLQTENLQAMSELARPAAGDDDFARRLRAKLNDADTDGLALLNDSLLDLQRESIRQKGNVETFGQLVSGLTVVTMIVLAAMLSALYKLRQQRAILHDLATHDPLTDLLNRRILIERANQLIATADRAGQTPVMAVLDIDHFKRLNDQFGHPAGDAVLRALAEHLRGHIRRTDLAARMGGDEIAILMLANSATGVRDSLERLRAEVERRPIVVGEDGVEARFTISIGIATPKGRPLATSFDELYSAADSALYRAKTAGRNRVAASWDVASVAGADQEER